MATFSGPEPKWLEKERASAKRSIHIVCRNIREPTLLKPPAAERNGDERDDEKEMAAREATLLYAEGLALHGETVEATRHVRLLARGHDPIGNLAQGHLDRLALAPRFRIAYQALPPALRWAHC